MKRLQKTISKCFRKVRIKEKVDHEKEEMFRIWKDMKKNVKNVNKDDLEDIERKLAAKYAEEIYENIKEKTKGIDCEDGGLNTGKLWNLSKAHISEMQISTNSHGRPRDREYINFRGKN